MTTKMKRQIIDANAFWIGLWGQSREKEFHVDGASVLRFIEVQVVLSEQVRVLSEGIRAISEPISELISELT